MPLEKRGTDARSAVVRALCSRAIRATLHRLRNLRTLVYGWLEMGVAGERRERLRARLDEDLKMLGRLDWLRAFLYAPPGPDRLARGDAPAVLVAAALGVGTPEEPRAESMPRIREPRAGIALATWLESCADPEDADAFALRWRAPDQLVVELAREHDADLSAWTRDFGDCVVHADGRSVRFRPGCFLAQDRQQQDGAGEPAPA